MQSRGTGVEWGLKNRRKKQTRSNRRTETDEACPNAAPGEPTPVIHEWAADISCQTQYERDVGTTTKRR